MYYENTVDEITSQQKNDKNLKAMELELLGSLLLKEGKTIPDVKSILTADDFLYIEHQILYRTILENYKQGIIPNMLNVAETLQRNNEIEIIGFELVMSLGEVAFTTAYSVNYAKTIKEKSARRKKYREMQQLSDKAREYAKKLIEPSTNLDEIISESKEYFNISNTQTKRGMRLDNFFKQSFQKLVNINKAYAERCTGFNNLDEKQIFSPGLYVIGGVPAAGKTTFCWQLLNQLDAFNEHCLYCSYEMSALELFSKTLARSLFLRDNTAKLTAADIRKGAMSPTLEKIIAEYSNCKTNLEILELHDENIDDLLRLVEPYCQNDKSPIVCIDYLQIIPPVKSEKFVTDKVKIDDIVRKLKSFQRETNTTFIVISSLNRSSYTQKADISFDAFKESGGIEYSADVVWTLQLKIDNNEDAETAKKRTPREILFKCLKNRQGNNYDLNFFYYPAYDYFSEYEIFIDHTNENDGDCPTEI